MGYHDTKPSENKIMLKQLMGLPSISQDDSYTRVHYVRYADDFIIGVEGSASMTKEILRKVELFVEKDLSLKFNPDKTGITKYSDKPVKFLGYNIMAPHMTGISKPLENIKVEGGRTVTRRKKIRIRFQMDLNRVLKKLEARKIIRKRTSHRYHNKLVYRGRFRGNLVNMDHADILRYYNSVIRGIHNYYDFVGNRGKLL